MRGLLVVAVWALPAVAAQPVAKPVIADKIVDRFAPAPFETQRVGGILGDRMRVNLEGRLLHVNEAGILDCFRHRPGRQEWAGEHAGKFLHAAANAWLYSSDERLKTVMDRVARELIAAQLPDGYLGTYTDDRRWTSWDVWVHKYDLIGLLSYYEATGYTPALESARRIGDLLARTFGSEPGQRDIITAGEHVGMAATSVLEPMVNLYRFTGDRRYLDFCAYLVRAWDQPNGPKIITSLNSAGSVFKTANGKAYEMMSNLVGLAELYRVSGNPLYLRTTQIAWKDIVDHRLYVDGTTSSSEHFADDDVLPGEESSNTGEGCATVTFLQLTWHLLRLTGEPQYADQLERTTYNALLGAQEPRSGDICYFTPLNGKKSPGPGINCCVSSEPRGISMIPQLAWGTQGEGAAILFYVPGNVKLATAAGEVSIESKTSFPLDGNIELTVRPTRAVRFPLFLRVPSWAARYRAAVNGDTFTGKPGGFLTIDREWSPGEIVRIEMDMTVHVLPGGSSYPYSVAIQRGPQLLALEETLNREVKDFQAAGPRRSEVKLAQANDRIPSNWHGKQAYLLEASVAGKPRDLVMVPFADARVYRVWLIKP